MPEIEIVLCQPDSPTQELTLYYKVASTPIAEKYVACLQECIAQKRKIIEANRFYGFPGDHRNRAWIANALNNTAEILNAYQPNTITEAAEEFMEQDQLNRLHHFFEIHRGSIEEPADFYASAPPAAQEALNEFNVLIHRYENFLRREARQQRGEGTSAQAVLRFEHSRPRMPLAIEDFDHFEVYFEFGMLFINYCEVGKTLYDLYRDKDDVIGEANIRPQGHFSADAFLYFGASLSHQKVDGVLADFWTWWDRNQVHLERLGFEKYSPRNAIGMIPVGSLIRDRGPLRGLAEDAIRNLLGRYQCFKTATVQDLAEERAECY